MPDPQDPSRSLAFLAPATPTAVPQPAPAESARENGDSWLTKALRTLFRLKPGSIRQDLEVVLDAGTPADTSLSTEERTMLRNILTLRERRVEDVMVPRADIISVQQDVSLGELIKVFESAGHSRLAVYNDTLDDPVGMVHIRDVVAYMAARATVKPDAKPKKKPIPANLDLRVIDLSVPLSSSKLVRECLFVPPSMPVIDLFTKMQATRIHLALVIDEYGGTDGLVTIEDIVEQIVGEIEDEHDEDEAPSVVRQPDGSFLADARASLEDVIATLGDEFDVGDAAEEVDTLGGYLFMKIGRVPVRGELVAGPGEFEIEVYDADPRRVKRLRIYRKKGPAAAPRDSKPRLTRADVVLSAPAATETPPARPPVTTSEPGAPGACR
jgi:CBS domain containing-hemolysin-like protein